MKMMNSTPAFLLFGLLVLTLGCKKDKMEEDRVKFLGTYNASEMCSASDDANYVLTISTSTTAENAVIITGLYTITTATLTGTASGSNLTIASQPITLSPGVTATISGSGAINGNFITLSYTLIYGTFSDQCTVTGTKQ